MVGDPLWTDAKQLLLVERMPLFSFLTLVFVEKLATSDFPFRPTGESPGD